MEKVTTNKEVCYDQTIYTVTIESETEWVTLPIGRKDYDKINSIIGKDD